MSKETLQQWVENAYWYMISEYTVAGVAAESNHGWELAEEWLNSKNQHIAAAGWATYSHLISIKPNEDIDKQIIESLLERVKNNIHAAKNRVRYTMNGFIIAVGSYIPELKEKAIQTAMNVGKVTVYMGETSCKVPLAKEYIEKVYLKGNGGKKRKNAIC